MEKQRTFEEYREDLKLRVLVRQMELESRLAELQTDSSLTSRAEHASIVKKLETVKHTLETGWDGVDETAAKRLSEWLVADA
jgi:hypothetical protein